MQLYATRIHLYEAQMHLYAIRMHSTIKNTNMFT